MCLQNCNYKYTYLVPTYLLTYLQVVKFHDFLLPKHQVGTSYFNQCADPKPVGPVMRYVTTSQRPHCARRVILMCVNANNGFFEKPVSDSSMQTTALNYHRTLVTDVVDDVRRVCALANQDLSLPPKTDNFTNACLTFVPQADDLGCFKCLTCAKFYMSEV